jgi:hypothetical protein
MRESGLTEKDKDIEQALPVEGMEADASRVQRAHLERDGNISVIPRDKEPRVLDISVADGVQTVRIAVERAVARVPGDQGVF